MGKEKKEIFKCVFLHLTIDRKREIRRKENDCREERERKKIYKADRDTEIAQERERDTKIKREKREK